MATTLGWLLGSFLLPGVALVTSGILVSVFQWFVLQGRIARPWRWIIVTSVGWFAGYLIAFLLVPQELNFFEGMIIGLAAGLAQWIVLRREVNWAGWWILFSMIGWTTGITLMPGLLLTGTMAGALTGFFLEILLRFSKSKAAAASISS
jgi:hypothetical protein